MFPSFMVVVPHGWEDITDSVETSVETLARLDGVGALQFSVALFTGGERPCPSPDHLLGMVKNLGNLHGFGEPLAVATEFEPLLLTEGSFRAEDDFLRVWQVSDGLNFAFGTYVSVVGEEAKELGNCDRIVRTLEFRPTYATRNGKLLRFFIRPATRRNQEGLWRSSEGSWS